MAGDAELQAAGGDGKVLGEPWEDRPGCRRVAGAGMRASRGPDAQRPASRDTAGRPLGHVLVPPTPSFTLRWQAYPWGLLPGQETRSPGILLLGRPGRGHSHLSHAHRLPRPLSSQKGAQPARAGPPRLLLQLQLGALL